MAFDKFLIAPISEGMRRDIKPWLIPESAFEELNNAYIFRGRVKNRVGSINTGQFFDAASQSSRLRMKLGTTDPITGNIAGTIPLGAAGLGAIGQVFTAGDDVFTVITDAAGAQDMLSTGAATVYTFNAATGAYNIQGAATGEDFYFYPALPVMGLTNYEKLDINDEDTYGFDTKFSYKLLSTGWERIGNSIATPAADIWTGTNSDFFWSTNWRGTDDYTYLLFSTNYSATDNLRYFDGTNWTRWQPQYASNVLNTIETARLIIPFQNRLLLLNTVESDENGINFTFVNRCRYSRVGSPIGADSYREDIDGEGSFIDAPTREAIVSCQKIKNRLIVFFERSTYELVYTGNQIYPFRWQEINSTLGCESTFSVVPFDKAVLGVGQTGIHACTGANVERIDTKIPDEVFEIHNDDDGVFRVHGIRDYYNEMVYWTMPYEHSYQSFPNKLLVFNYKENTWAFFDDHVTAFGYHQISDDLTWSEMDQEWEQNDDQWNDGTMESKFRYVIAGNQHGYTFLMHREFEFNAISKPVTDITEAAGVITVKVIAHNLSSGDWISFVNANGCPELEDNNYKVNVQSADTFTIDHPPVFTGPYTGGAGIILVSKVDIYSKRFNFYSKQGDNTNIEKTDFLVDKNDDGALTVDYLVSASRLSMRQDGIDNGAILGSSVLEMDPYTDLENVQKRFWHAVYLQAQGESIQLRLYWTDEQMRDGNIPYVGFEIHGILFHASPTQEL